MLYFPSIILCLTLNQHPVATGWISHRINTLHNITDYDASISALEHQAWDTTMGLVSLPFKPKRHITHAVFAQVNTLPTERKYAFGLDLILPPADCLWLSAARSLSEAGGGKSIWPWRLKGKKKITQEIGKIWKIDEVQFWHGHKEAGLSHLLWRSKNWQSHFLEGIW